MAHRRPVFNRIPYARPPFGNGNHHEKPDDPGDGANLGCGKHVIVGCAIGTQYQTKRLSDGTDKREPDAATDTLHPLERSFPRCRHDDNAGDRYRHCSAL